MKTCPQCECIDVPDKADRCPFCGYRFVEKKEESIGFSMGESKDTQKPVSEPQSLGGFSSNSIDDSFFGEPLSGAEEKKEPIFKDEGPKDTVIVKKKSHGFRNFLLSVGIVLAVYVMFIDKPSDSEDQSAGVGINGQESVENINGQEQSQGGVANINGESDTEQQMEEDEPFDERAALLSQIEYADQYILPLSNVMYLERSDLEGLTPEQLRIARNELYARHGRVFQDEGLQAHFNNCQWYFGYISAEDFSEEEYFNEYELANRDFIREYEHELGVNGQ